MLCDKTFNLPSIGSPQQTKVQIPPKSNLASHWVLLELLTGVEMRGYLQEQKWLKDSWITKARLRTTDNSQKLRPWSILCSLEAPQQVVECPFQVTHLVSASYRQQLDLVSESSLLLGVSESGSQKSLCLLLEARGPLNLVSSRNFMKLGWAKIFLVKEFPEAILGHLPTCLRSFLQDEKRNLVHNRRWE